MDAVSSFVSDVDLPSNARKRIWLYGRIERGETDGGVVTFSGRGIQTQIFKFSLNSPDDQTPIALTISDSDERLAFTASLPAIRQREEIFISKRNGQNVVGVPGYNAGSSQVNTPNFALNGVRAVETLGAGHEWVPTRWVGLDSVDLVILHDFPHSSLAPEQLDALRDYAASGGTILILGGANWQRLAQSPLRELWPLQPESSQTASQAQTAQIVRTYIKKVKESGDRLGGAPVVLASGQLSPLAQPLSGKLPPSLASWRSFGAGRVLWLAFDPTRPPFVGWSGQNLLWADIFKGRSQATRLQDVDPQLATFASGVNYQQPNYYAGMDANTGGNSASALASRLRLEMVRSPQLKTPPSSSIAWFLALYVFFLVPVNYVILRSMDKREWAWLTVPLIVIIFSVLSFVAALRIKGTEVRQRQVNMVFGSNGSSRARADTLLWLFSPRKTSYAIDGQNAAGKDLATMSLAPFADARRSDTLDNAQIVQPGDRSMKIDEAPINMWDYKTFVGNAVVDSGQGVKVTRKGGQISLANRTPFDWRGAVWVEDNRFRAIGDVKSGVSATVKGDANVPVRTEAGDNNVARSQSASAQIIQQSGMETIFPAQDTDGARNRMARAALNAALSQAQLTDQRPYIVAWGTQPVADLHTQNILEAPQQVTLFVWQLDKATN